MSEHVFRNPDKFQQLPFRDWIRKNIPSGREGYCFDDCDLIMRLWGPRNDEDGIGRLALIELKFGNAWTTLSQQIDYYAIDEAMRAGDLDGRRWMGTYVIQYDNEDWDEANFKINRKSVTHEELWAFLTGILEIEPMKWNLPPNVKVNGKVR